MIRSHGTSGPGSSQLIRRRRSRKSGATHEQHYKYYLFEQFIFYSQWEKLKQYAAYQGIRIVGDIPIYVGLDSADVWSQQELFELDPKTLKPLRVSGVPTGLLQQDRPALGKSSVPLEQRR